jgi:hypothetical protein
MAAAASDGAPASPPRPSEDAAERYTGVVVIHGVGDIKRNTTLEQAVNTLAYWFNHEAGLALRQEGTDRLWLRAQPSDGRNPDARPATATMELAAPGHEGTAADAAPLRLKFREVWWAESFGLPSVRTAVQWALVQFREQAAHLLIPIGRRLERAPPPGRGVVDDLRRRFAG